MSQSVNLVFASCSEDLVESLIDETEKLAPGLPTLVVSEFAPPRGEWVPYRLSWSLEDNRKTLLAKLKGRSPGLVSILLQPNMPFWPMRRMGWQIRKYGLVVFNENIHHFSLRPSSIPQMLRHMAWRTGNFFRWQFGQGGKARTWLWRFAHPKKGFQRPVLYRQALNAGLKRDFPAAAALPPAGPALPGGISVVIPSRNGRDLLATCLPPLLAQRPDEVIIVDNGSDDGTAQWLKESFPSVLVEVSGEPLSFAKAVNRGIARASRSHTLLLNNDMIVEPGFLTALEAPFKSVPDLFGASAQIFFPEGVRREETGKTVMLPREHPSDFTVWCNDPQPGENHSYVLYGSGGCTLYDTSKLRRLGSFDEIYEPAYVEDLDLGFRAWRLNWPTVFVADARVLHQHRATTKRYFTEKKLQLALEVNYLKFLVRAFSDPAVAKRLWFEAVYRLNFYACERPRFLRMLIAGRDARQWVRALPAAQFAEAEILDLNNGRVAVFPGRAPSGKPRVLITSCYLPFPLSHGGAVRMYNLIRRAAATNDQILVAFSPKLQAVPQELLDICCEVVVVETSGSHDRALTERPQVVEEFDRPEFHAALRQTVRKWKPEIAQLEFTQMAVYAKDCAPAKTILVEHDVTLDLYGQLLKQGGDWEIEREFHKWTRFEKAAWKTIDCVVTMSEKDQRLIEGARAEVLINGVDLERFQPSDEEPEPRRLLFIGSFAHLPNVLALDWFLKEVWPRLDALKPKLHIIAGNRPEYFLERYRDQAAPNLSQPGIELESFVSDVRPAYRRAMVVVAPLLASAGTNIKIMEAMAMGKAIVSTPGGVNGLDIEPGNQVVVTESPERMAAAIKVLLADPKQRMELEGRARRGAQRDYNWDDIARRQDALYQSLRAGSGAPGAGDRDAG